MLNTHIHTHTQECLHTWECLHIVTLVYYAFDQVEDSNAALFGLSLSLGEDIIFLMMSKYHFQIFFQTNSDIFAHLFDQLFGSRK